MRPDISNSVIHFTKGATPDEALWRLLEIVQSGLLLGGTGMIRGDYRCVCFTEAPPLPALAADFSAAGSFTRYQPFGLMFSKQWLFSRGGRPVVYQTDTDYDLMPAELRWRHVRYEPDAIPPIDFTWEREWRLQCENLSFTPADVALVVPDPDWQQYVVGVWNYRQQVELESYSTVLDHLVVQQLEQPMPWRLVYLSN